ncbi:MAG: chorismate mutase [Mycobacterium sp.]
MRRAFGVCGVAAAIAAAPMAPATAEPPSEPLYALIDAATQRLQTADPVAASKWLSGGPITDPARVQQVLATVSAEAESLSLPSDYVTRVFTDQINATEAIQYSRFSWWKLDPAAAPTSAPDLSSSRALIDGLNQRMVGEIAGQWPVLHSPDCPARLDAAKAAVAADRGLDPLYVQALDAATRDYCS